jgi:hypothetical protein
MKALLPFTFDEKQFVKELEELRKMLGSGNVLKERKDILPFFRARSNLAAALGYHHNKSFHCNLMGWEYDLFGDFACDLAIGDSVRKSFTFVEFEDAAPNSLFVKQSKKATRAWSPRLNDGYGQIIDWFYKLADRRNSDEFEARFGKRSIDFTGLLVIGRNQYMNAGERLRLEWRREHVVVNSKRIQCITFDELLDDLQYVVANYPPTPTAKQRRKP